MRMPEGSQRKIRRPSRICGYKRNVEMTESKFKPVEEQLAYLRKGVAEIIPENELKASLEKSLRTGKPLRVYLGVDPTAPDLHLGHTVVLRKLKHFQDLGHTAVFLIGDFSAMIGDPTGVSETRPPLTREQVDANAKTYLEQVYKILDREKTEVRYNSEWLSKMSAEDVVRLCSHYRLARMLEREDFRSRLDKGQPISVHELLYPLLTAIDAVKLQSDVELGATEQKFNLLVHREIQREYGLPGQAILTMPILVGLDGQRKMSKSLGNYVGITEAPGEIFGKIMSIPDELMWSYYELVTDLAQEEIAALKRKVETDTLHPKQAKEDLAKKIVDDFYSSPVADTNDSNASSVTIGTSTAAEFNRIFRDRQVPEEMKEIRLQRVPGGLFVIFPKVRDIEERMTLSVPGNLEKWSKLLASMQEVPSTSDAERVIKQGGFEIDGVTMKDPTCKIDLDKPASYEVRVGKKKFLRVIVE
jgi:tyrosyl-tRNA synthetase